MSKLPRCKSCGGGLVIQRAIAAPKRKQWAGYCDENYMENEDCHTEPIEDCNSSKEVAQKWIKIHKG